MSTPLSDSGGLTWVVKPDARKIASINLASPWPLYFWMMNFSIASSAYCPKSIGALSICCSSSSSVGIGVALALA